VWSMHICSQIASIQQIHITYAVLSHLKQH